MQTPSRPRVSIVSFSPISQDARVLRQIGRLKERCDVAVIGYGEPAGAGASVAMHRLPDPEAFMPRNMKAIPRLVAGRVLPTWGYDQWYWRRPDLAAAVPLIEAAKPDLILANDWSALPAAVRAADVLGVPIVADLHEYSPLQLSNRRAWMALISPMIDFTLRRYSSRVAAFVTVNETIARRYHQEYGIDPIVVMNAPDTPPSIEFRPTNPQRVRLIHHGVATPERKLELMIQMLARADSRFSLHFMLLDRGEKYVQELKALARRVAPDRVHFEKAVPPAAIVNTIAQYDVGCYLLPPVNYNQSVALPNKFFDFISAGLALFLGPSPEMGRLAQQYGVGVVTETFDPDQCATKLNSLTVDQIDKMKQSSLVARDVLCARNELDKLEALILRLAAG